MKKRLVWLSLAVLTVFSTFSILFVSYARSSDDLRNLGVEINTKNNPFYFPAAVGREMITGLVRVGKSENASPDDITGLKIAPTMKDGKVLVEVFAVYGDIHAVKSCKELEAFKSKLLGSQVLSKGESLNLSEFANLKRTENEDPLLVKIVGMKKDYNDNPIEKISGAAQTPAGCGFCGTLACCPSPGKCIGCGDCGLVCNTEKQPPKHETPPADDTVGK